jgi:VanZ family protein
MKTRHIAPQTLSSWLPVAGWMAFIFTMSTGLGSAAHTSTLLEPIVQWIKPGASEEEFEMVHFIVRKIGHLSEYAVLGLLLLRALRQTTLRSNHSQWPWRAAGVALLVAATYAATDEWHQSFVPGRTPAVADVMIDSCGAFIGLLSAYLVEKFRPAAALTPCSAPSKIL